MLTKAQAMLTLTAIGSMALLTGCLNPDSGGATLDALRAPMAAHAAALAKDGGPLSVSTGRDVIAIYEAGLSVR